MEITPQELCFSQFLIEIKLKIFKISQFFLTHDLVLNVKKYLAININFLFQNLN